MTELDDKVKEEIKNHVTNNLIGFQIDLTEAMKSVIEGHLDQNQIKEKEKCS